MHAPLFELGVDDSVGEALTTDSDALQHTVTLQLMQDQFRIHDTWQRHQLSHSCTLATVINRQL